MIYNFSDTTVDICNKWREKFEIINAVKQQMIYNFSDTTETFVINGEKSLKLLTP
jgi:hypothetical protein